MCWRLHTNHCGTLSSRGRGAVVQLQKPKKVRGCSPEPLRKMSAGETRAAPFFSLFPSFPKARRISWDPAET